MMKCRCCNRDMVTAGVQTYPAKYNLKPLVYIECRNRDCALWMQTFNEAEYGAKDLTPYLKGKSENNDNLD